MDQKTYMLPVALMTALPKTGPHAKPTMKIPPSLAKMDARDPSGVVSETYALTVAVRVEIPPRQPSRMGPTSSARYPPGTRYGKVATMIKQASLGP